MDVNSRVTEALESHAAYTCVAAKLPSTGATVYVIHEVGHGLYDVGTRWLRYMADTGKSPNTIRNYGTRVAWYLSWADSSGIDWREPTLNILASWKQNLLTTPYTTGKQRRTREPATVNAWMIAVTEFYKWTAANGIVERELVDRFLEQKYIPPGQRGGEMGRTITVKASELTTVGARKQKPPEWLEEASQRQAILNLELNARDRFLVDLLYATGLRGGEALSLFREDLHFLHDNNQLGCTIQGPHIHVKRNETLNNARAKSSPRGGSPNRWVPVPVDVVASYENYRFERVESLGPDTNPHVLVNTTRGLLGAAYTPDSLADLFKRMSQRMGFYVRPHMLRHTRATLWLHGIEGPQLTPDTVQKLLGHASAQSTMIYVHSTDEDLRAAVEGVTLRPKETQGEQR